MCASLPRHARHAVTSEKFFESARRPAISVPVADVWVRCAVSKSARNALTCSDIRRGRADPARAGRFLAAGESAAGVHYTLGF